MSWETLDAIADSVNPILGVIALVWPWIFWRSFWRRAALSVFTTLVSVAFVYVIAWLDARYGWWPSMGLDFSTHTAVAVTLVVSLCAIKPSIWFAWVGVLCAYVALMLYQGYHTAADIFTTAAVIAPPLCLDHWWLRRADRPG
ncbi:MAG TPA: hypothetical protein VGD45_19640 [Steroidobacter sp.]|uniref:hypothetical protein n=1 Tax=Steroidobacter sp. TaxID=1978227 RepID=UPI002ED8F5CB